MHSCCELLVLITWIEDRTQWILKACRKKFELLKTVIQNSVQSDPTLFNLPIFISGCFPSFSPWTSKSQLPELSQLLLWLFLKLVSWWMNKYLFIKYHMLVMCYITSINNDGYPAQQTRRSKGKTNHFQRLVYKVTSFFKKGKRKAKDYTSPWSSILPVITK